MVISEPDTYLVGKHVRVSMQHTDRITGIWNYTGTVLCITQVGVEIRETGRIFFLPFITMTAMEILEEKEDG